MVGRLCPWLANIIHQALMNATCQGCHIAFNVTEVLLHVAKEALQSWEGENHGPDISNQLVPLSDNEKLLAGWDS